MKVNRNQILIPDNIMILSPSKCITLTTCIIPRATLTTQWISISKRYMYKHSHTYIQMYNKLTYWS